MRLRSLGVLLLVLAACEVGGGMSDQSVTVPGEDGIHLRAQAECSRFAARIEMERTTTQVKMGHDVHYIFDKTLVRQQLRLVIGEGGTNTSFELAEHDEASSFERHELSISPDQSRLAYRLDDRPWQLVYVVSPSLAVHAPEQGVQELDWARVPTLDAAIVDVHRAQELRLDGRFSFNKITPMLQWLRDEHGEDRLVQVLFDLLTPRPYHAWDEHLKLLSPEGLAALEDRIRARVLAPGAAAPHYAKAWRLGVIDPREHEAVAERGARLLATDPEALANEGEDLAAYLAAYAEQQPALASPLACELLDRPEPPYSLQEGRAVRVAANAACKR